VIGSIDRWNMKFTDQEEIKGDFQQIARGNISLVAKEVRGAALAQWKTTLTPRQQVLIRDEDLMVEELKSRDLPIDILKRGKEADDALAQFDAMQAQVAQTEQGLTAAKTQKETAAAQKSQAQAQDILTGMQDRLNSVQQQANLAMAKIRESMAKAKGVKDNHELNAIKLILDQIGATAGAGGKASRAAKKPGK
jgi:hypothetical protein